ncbi:MAG: hypothetical protein F4173_08285 [Acidobacteriia bacterium]|nr:hypothetical protein [Terriglobia bacterium]
MKLEFGTTELQAQPYLGIRAKTTIDKLGAIMGPLFGELPCGTMATVTHIGPYEGLPNTWAALTEWIRSQGLEAAGAPWEVYVTDPGAEPDQSKWRTDIFFPVR